MNFIKVFIFYLFILNFCVSLFFKNKTKNKKQKTKKKKQKTKDKGQKKKKKEKKKRKKEEPTAFGIPE